MALNAPMVSIELEYLFGVGAHRRVARRLSENKVLELVSLQWDAKIINFFAPIFIVNLNSLILTSLLPHNDLIW